MRSGARIMIVLGLLGWVAVPTSAAAATVSELAAAAVFEHCPRLTESEGNVADDAELRRLGFDKPIAGRDHPRFGPMHGIEAEADDGSISILSADSTTMCSVTMTGAGAKAAFGEIFEARSRLADDLVLDGAASGLRSGLDMRTFRTATIDGVYLGVQFVAPTDAAPTAPFIVQQYVIEE